MFLVGIEFFGLFVESLVIVNFEFCCYIQNTIGGKGIVMMVIM